MCAEWVYNVENSLSCPHATVKEAGKLHSLREAAGAAELPHYFPQDCSGAQLTQLLAFESYLPNWCLSQGYLFSFLFSSYAIK